ncbi:MAG: SUMF1/EgtB/PvdO family nonheme iron enzyme [Chloroflexi bacterium]|nr:SUMF1/EgtB/PvdO family nonheme iron enzyme [Chloroflexota bacterium]
MPANQQFDNIIDRVKKTFAVLRVMFTETPPNPAGVPVQLSQLFVDEPAPVVARAVEPENLKAPEAAKHVPESKKKPEKVPNASRPVREALLLSEAHQRYLENILAAHEFMALPGFGTGGQSLKIQFEKVYVPLQLMDLRLGVIRPERDDGPYGGAAVLSLASALQRYRRLVITGMAGSGKSTLINFMLLTYARSLMGEKQESAVASAKPAAAGKQRIINAEDDHLPILISVRALGHYLKEKYRKSGPDSPVRLLNYLRIRSETQNLALPDKFFDSHIVTGRALVLLDGMDEIDDQRLRQRVMRLIVEFVKRFPSCRYIVTSRPFAQKWPDENTPLLSEQFGTIQIREFIPGEVRQFVRVFSNTVEIGLAGAETSDVLSRARLNTQKLIGAIETNSNLADLAVTPQALTMLALVQRHREQLPEHQAYLYDSAVDVMLDQWDLANLPEQATRLEAGQRSLDRVERRRALEILAFWLHQNNLTEASRDVLKTALQPWFLQRYHADQALASAALDTFMRFVGESFGLFVECGADQVGFSGRIYQEILAAHALSEREDSLAYIVKCLPSPWWHAVILFEAGLLSTQKHRVSELVQSIQGAGQQSRLDSNRFSLLAAECLMDFDLKDLDPGLLDDVRKSLKKVANVPLQPGDRQYLTHKLMASNALTGLQGGQSLARFWQPPFGEPEWVKIPSGEFWMGDVSANDNPAQRIFLPAYQISRVPVTNAQYALYIADTGAEPPDHWRVGQPPRGREHHPVVNVNWHEALAYCSWLAQKIDQPVRLPSEAEWEKAARGAENQRPYPWGEWAELCSNTSELALGDTTPVGFFPNGASPFGVLDLTGNVREWTRSLADFGYPYDPTDHAREDLLAPDNQARVLRGGSYYYTSEFARSATRQRYYPDFRFYNFGFRVVISPST